MKESAAKKYVTAATRRSQRKIPSRITHPHAAPRIHCGSFSGFSAPLASRRCVFAVKSQVQQYEQIMKQVQARRKRNQTSQALREGVL